MIGHDDAWKTWRNGIASGRLHHGWILAGREGLGKATFARAAAAEWVSEAGAKQPPPESHPDILFMTPLAASDDDARKQAEGKPYALKRSISVDQVRLMQRRLVTRPTLGDRRAVIIDSADLLEKSAVNAAAGHGFPAGGAPSRPPARHDPLTLSDHAFRASRRQGTRAGAR
jgi:DNA polymerase-3 subunit delta'